MKKITLRDKDAMQFNQYGGSDSSGNPYAYYEYGSVIGLFPIPTTEETIKYYYVAKPVDITSSSVEFSIPATFHPYLQDYVLSRAYLKDQDDVRSGWHYNVWQKSIIDCQHLWSRRKSANRFTTVKVEDNYPDTEIGIT
jgi:hypothetical protein